MYTVSHLYDPVVKDIQVDDREFWNVSLKKAISLQNDISNDKIDTKQIKMKSPAYFCTQMYNDKTIAFTRKQFNRMMKDQRRKSIVLDIDCESMDEYKASKQLFIDYANKHNLWVMTYPTISFPDKPHFRVVFLVNRGLNPVNYAKAVSWLYNEVSLPVTDESDLDIRASRNLPIFINETQINECYSNFEEDDCEKLNTKLWSKFKMDKDLQNKINRRITRSKAEPEQLEKSNYYYDKEQLIQGWTKHVKNNTKDYMTYDYSWKAISSIAKAYVKQEINWDTALELSKILANIDEENKENWLAGNIELLEKFSKQDNLNEAKDLLQYDNGILMSIKLRSDQEDGNE